MFALRISCGAQTSPELALKYQKFADIYFYKERYREADSLFSLSLKVKQSKYCFYQRALCREKLGKSKDHCRDLAFASHMGHQQAYRDFLKKCGKVDSTCYALNERSGCDVTYRFADTVIMFSSALEELRSRNDNNIQPHVSEDSVFYSADEWAQFPGGEMALDTFIKKNIVTPDTLKNLRVKPVCFARFVVNKDGSISDIKIIKPIIGCSACSDEAVRLIKLMPKFKPGKIEGKSIRMFYTIPIKFRIQKQ